MLPRSKESHVMLILCQPQNFGEDERDVLERQGFQKMNFTMREPCSDGGPREFKSAGYVLGARSIYISLDYNEALTIAARTNPDIVVLDPSIPVATAFATTNQFEFGERKMEVRTTTVTAALVGTKAIPTRGSLFRTSPKLQATA
ncbi:MAG: hypothetical protein M3N08_01215 [Pseudomonadota bacterium]|nr:hypothetical protein [Pseudomonadota bacterium]